MSILSPEIPDADSSSSDGDDVVEVAELEHFSGMLQKAQQLAVQAQKISTAQKQPRELTGKSRSTLYRQKRAKKELAKDGFHSLPNYMALMEKKSQGVHSQGRGTACQGSEGPWRTTVLRDGSRVAERMPIRPSAYETSHNVTPVD